jgi:syntaxin 17
MNQNKVPIKVAEISINKFNEQIHHKVVQLKNFRISNSNASTTLNDLEKLRKDAINCLRVVKQLKQLLIEIDHLKSRTRDEDHDKFDELTSRRREEALKEIKLYQGIKGVIKVTDLRY